MIHGRSPKQPGAITYRTTAGSQAMIGESVSSSPFWSSHESSSSEVSPPSDVVSSLVSEGTTTIFSAGSSRQLRIEPFCNRVMRLWCRHTSRTATPARGPCWTGWFAIGVRGGNDGWRSMPVAIHESGPTRAFVGGTSWTAVGLVPCGCRPQADPHGGQRRRPGCYRNRLCPQTRGMMHGRLPPSTRRSSPGQPTTIGTTSDKGSP